MWHLINTHWRGPGLGLPLTAKRSFLTQGNPTPSTTWRPRLTMSRPRFKTRKTEEPGQDPHWQDVMLPTSWQHLRPVPHKRDPLQQVSASHGKSPPRTSSPRLRLRRGPWHATWAWSTSASTMTHGGTIPRAMQRHQLAAHASSWPRQEP
jgi:hypothetical protein